MRLNIGENLADAAIHMMHIHEELLQINRQTRRPHAWNCRIKYHKAVGKRHVDLYLGGEFDRRLDIQRMNICRVVEDKVICIGKCLERAQCAFRPLVRRQESIGGNEAIIAAVGAVVETVS